LNGNFFIKPVEKPTDSKPRGISSPFKIQTIRGLGGNAGWGPTSQRVPHPCGWAMHKQDDAEPSCAPISLLSFLEAENIRLRQAVMELSLDARVLREALKRMETHDHVVNTSVMPTRGRSAE